MTTKPNTPFNAKILIVDDVIENIQVLGAVLRNAGYSVIVGQSGKDAVRLSLRSKPDLILLDVMMPVWMATRRAA